MVTVKVLGNYRINNPLSHVLYFVAETGRRRNAHEATIKVCVILFPQPKT